MMIASSIRKLGIAGVASLLLVSGLTTQALTTQAAGEESGPITLLQSPAIGTLASLGGVSGYVDSQSGGDADTWLSSQGIDPTASGPITDTTIPDQAQGMISVDNNTVSLAPDARGVDVGYLAGDARGTQTISASLSNLAIAPGHENDAYPMTTTEFLTWLNGTTWTGSFSMPGVAIFNITVTWSLSGATVTPNLSTPINLALANQLQNGINQGITAPGDLKLSDVVAGIQQYSWTDTADVPYSFAYNVGQALAPGGSVSVDLNEAASRSPLSGFTIDNAQTSGVLSSIPLSTWLPDDAIPLLSSLDEYSDFASATTTADMASVIMADLMNEGAIDSWVSDIVITAVQEVLTGINAADLGYTMQPLSAASQATIQSNTPAAMALFVDTGFPDLMASGISADIQVNSTLDPGSVISLIPTGVTYTAPIEVDTDVSTLTLSSSTMVIDPGTCTGAPTTDPQSVIATATVIDTTGVPVVGADVRFGVESPLVLGSAVAATDKNGVASAVITVPNPSEADTNVAAHVTAHVDFGSGADLSPALLTVQHPVTTVVLPLLTVQPTISSPVSANGQDSYTASIILTDQCGVPQPGKVVEFSVTGSAKLSITSASSDKDGYVSVTLTDEKIERVTVSATDTLGQPVAGPPVMVTFTYPPCTGDACVTPVPAGGTLTLDPFQLSSGASTVATATVIDAIDQPVPLASVDFRIDGDAQFADGSTAVSLPTGGSGEAVALISTTGLDCDNLGFDVYATVTIAGQVVELAGSPARVTLVPSGDECELPVAAPQVVLANASTIGGYAAPGATVQVVDATGAVLGTAQADTTGYWSMSTPSGTPSQQITANALNSKGVVVASGTAWLDTDPPAPARIDQATTQQVSGTVGAVEPSASITVIFSDGTIIETSSDTDGSYSVPTPEGMTDAMVTVIVTDAAGNSSTPATAQLVTSVPPTSKVSVSLKYASVDIGDIQVITGKGFRNLERATAQLCSSTSCVAIGTGYASLTGQVTINIVVPDRTMPGSYTVTLTGTSSGQASAGFQVTVPTAPSAAKLNTYLLWWAKWWWVFA